MFPNVECEGRTVAMQGLRWKSARGGHAATLTVMDAVQAWNAMDCDCCVRMAARDDTLCCARV